jgi:hypothetical protein
MFQVRCHTWNSSLNRDELFEHLRIAHGKGGMVFQAAEAETTRRFLKAILEGKGLPAECTLNNMPSSAAIAAATTAAANVVAKESAAAAGSIVDTNAITAAGMAHMMPLQPTLQTLPEAHSLFQEAVSRAEPLWFHPSLAEQRSTALDISSSCLYAAEEAASGTQENLSAAVLPAAASSSSPAAAPVNHTSGTLSSSIDAVQSPSQIVLLTFVQFVSIEQPAARDSPTVPSVVIRNTVDSNSHSRFGRLDAAAAACFSRVLAAAAHGSRFKASKAPVPRKRVRHQKLRSPPREIEDDIADTSSTSLASSGSASSHRKSRLTAESLPLHRLAQLSALLYCSDDHSTALSE